MTGRCAGIRQTGLKFDDVVAGFEQPGPVIDRFREAARGLIAAGADVIIPGEIPMNVLLAGEGVHRVDDVPVIDCLGVTLKMTEMMVELKASTGLEPQPAWLAQRRAAGGAGRRGDGLLLPGSHFFEETLTATRSLPHEHCTATTPKRRT